MSEILNALASASPWDRLPMLLSALDSNEDMSPEDLSGASEMLPSAHRQILARGVLGEHEPAGCVPPPQSMRYLGPVGHLLGMPEASRAPDMLAHLPDYEEHLVNAPELLLLLPRDSRAVVEAAMQRHTGIVRMAAASSQAEWVDSNGVGWPYTGNSAISKEQLLRLLDGLPSIYLDEASRLEVLQAAPSIDVSYADASGSRHDISSELFQPWDPKWTPHAMHDGEALRLWVSGKLELVPFSSIMHATVSVSGRSTDVMIGGARKSGTHTNRALPASPARSTRSSRIATSAIYKALSDGMTTARVEVGESGDSHLVFARSFPGGTEDSSGRPHTFGEHPDSDTIVLWDVSKSSLVSIPVDSIVSVSYTSDTDGAPLQMENVQEGDSMSHKNLADIEYLKGYLEDMGKLQAKVSGKIIGVADLETVGLLGKNYEDSEDKSHGQILQAAGVKMIGGMSALKDAGDTLNLKARLSPHNQKILHSEVKGGFSEKLVDPDSHSDILSHNLAYVHRDHMSFEDTDIFGLPLATRYMTKRGKPGAKEYKMPKRLSEADYSAMMTTEARLPPEVEVLTGIIGWLTGTGGYHRKVDMLCGHNLYSFDRNYLEARLKRHGMPPLPNIPYLDTLHLAGIMFLPALSALAFIPSVAPETGEEIVPADVKEHAKELVGALRTGLNLSSLAKALGVPLSDDAHDALADTVATARVLESMLQWLEDKHQYILKHAHYDRLRKGAWENYAKGFRNKYKKRKV